MSSEKIKQCTMPINWPKIFGFEWLAKGMSESLFLPVAGVARVVNLHCDYINPEMRERAMKLNGHLSYFASS
jgi:hypothetical protein